MIIGRKEEIGWLKKAYASERSEFVAVYGRRRVGKTFLVRETFGNSFTFYHTGLSNSPLRKQLANWQSSLREYGGKKTVRFPRTWLDAFDMLKEIVVASTEQKKVIFIDELPWMDTPKSGFVAALEHFWNGWASARNDILLITCGSATSWIMNKLIRNKGGLHNRVTVRIPLNPFVLRECWEYAVNNRLGFTQKQVMQCYMVMGGVPYYWSYLDGELSLAQNIDNLFFNPNGQLYGEFNELYASLFKKPELYVKVIQGLATKRMGLMREEIIKASKEEVQDNGKLTQVLEDLEYCGFIRKYFNYGYGSKNAIYQLVDPYTLFYYRFIKENKHNDPHFWTANQDSPTFYNWNGLAFERVCLDHVRQIKKALGVEGVVSNEYSWVSKNSGANGAGAQIDLLIDRNDDVIDLCEMKCTKTPFSMTEEEYNKIQNRKDRFRAETKTTKAIHLILISASGVKRNPYLDDFQKIISGDALFE